MLIARILGINEMEMWLLSSFYSSPSQTYTLATIPDGHNLIFSLYANIIGEVNGLPRAASFKSTKIYLQRMVIFKSLSFRNIYCSIHGINYTIWDLLKNNIVEEEIEGSE